MGPMRILVTGAAGQVGTDLLPLLVEKGHDVTVFDIAPRPGTCPDAVRWVRGDITGRPEVFDAVKETRPELHLPPRGHPLRSRRDDAASLPTA